jgi:hypothetical protein
MDRMDDVRNGCALSRHAFVHQRRENERAIEITRVASGHDEWLGDT